MKDYFRKMSFTSGSRWSDVYLAAAARGVSVCGDFLAATALALALQTAGAGGLAVSGLMLAATLPLVVLAPVTGRVADRFDSRALLVGAGLVQAGVCGALAFAEDPRMIIVLTGLLACGLAVTQPTLSALVPEMVRRDDLPRASAINQTAGTLGILVGPALAGLLVGQLGVRLPLLLDAASYLALVVAGLLLRTRRAGRGRPARDRERLTTTGGVSEDGRPSRSVDPELPVGDGRTVTAAAASAQGTAWRLRRDPLLFTMVVAMAAVIGGLGAINVIEVFYVRESLAGSTTMFGIVTAAWTVGVLIGTGLLTRYARRLADDGSLVLATLAMLGGCSLMVLAASAVSAAPLLIPLWLVGGAFNGGDNVFSNVVTARRVPPEARGRAFAALGAAIQGASMLGYLLGGVLLDRIAPRPLVAAAGTAGLLVVVVSAVPVRRAVRRSRTVSGESERGEAQRLGAG
jgi:MFS family permease